MLQNKLTALGFCVVLTSACGNQVVVEDGAGGASSATVVTSATVGTGKGSSTKASVTQGVTSSTTGGAGGIGEPSDVFPAPHDPPPIVESLGGNVLSAPSIVPIFFSDSDPNMKAGEIAFVDALGATSYWTSTTSEYGVGPATATAPVTLAETAPQQIADAQISAWLTGKLNANDAALPPPDINKIYTVFYPPQTQITLPDGQGGNSLSCQGFGGYHSSMNLDAAHGNMKLAYAVMPDCGTFGSLQGLDAVTGPISHEMIEAATDPDPVSVPAFGETDIDHIPWTFVLGGEVGDMCAATPGIFTNFPGLANAAQRTWSNASSAAGHDPCVPIPAGQVYFNAVPKSTDVIDLGGGFQFNGVQIPVGGTRTIDINLFSEGPTDPFTVQVFDATQFQTGNPALDLELDEDTGQNGQTLHLTINVLSQGPFGFEPFYLFSSVNGQSQIWIGAVGN